jgi:hypothetical protein
LHIIFRLQAKLSSDIVHHVRKKNKKYRRLLDVVTPQNEKMGICVKVEDVPYMLMMWKLYIAVSVLRVTQARFCFSCFETGTNSSLPTSRFGRLKGPTCKKTRIAMGKRPSDGAAVSLGFVSFVSAPEGHLDALRVPFRVGLFSLCKF